MLLIVYLTSLLLELLLFSREARKLKCGTRLRVVRLHDMFDICLIMNSGG